MFKALAKLEHVIEGKVFQLICDNECKISSIKDALVVFLGHVANLEAVQKSQMQQASQTVEQPVQESPKE